MLRNLKLPKKLRTIHYQGQKVEIWMNSRKVEAIDEFSLREKIFLQQFISNLEKMGWTVLI
ncbi:MAG: hypothetical protein ACW97Z_03950 [Candidatus Hodarchaeales archaeon]|jgi:hypothetical protein